MQTFSAMMGEMLVEHKATGFSRLMSVSRIEIMKALFTKNSYIRKYSSEVFILAVSLEMDITDN